MSDSARNDGSPARGRRTGADAAARPVGSRADSAARTQHDRGPGGAQREPGKPERAPAGDYVGRRIALLTQHGKERVIAPVLEPALGCRVERVGGYDTDTLGTFTREIPRTGTQLEAARRKARVGMALSGLPLGIASEGSFGPDPFAGLLPWNAELVVFVDDERGLEIVGVAQGSACHAQLLTGNWVEAAAFARQAAFPAQQLVVRPQGENDPRIRKSIAAWEELEAAFAWARSQSPDGRVFLATDLRAHTNPTRMLNIGRAAMDLADKLGSRCPACGTPGFWIVERVPGLPCADCGAPTRELRAEIFGCLRCDHRSRRDRIDRAVADPGRCDWCNP